jgi:hypothetical protein
MSQGQNLAAHASTKIIESLTGGNISSAQSAAEDTLWNQPNIVREYEKLVEDCRKCRTTDPEVK